MNIAKAVIGRASWVLAASALGLAAGVSWGQTDMPDAASVTFETVYSFCSLTNCADGAVPIAGLVQATNGDLYGTTLGGGANEGGTISK
jgi:hypothetical protein